MAEYWLHVQVHADSAEHALTLSKTVVDLHPVLDDHRWDISEGIDWADIVKREA
jgi:hypothetical protein